MNFLSSDRLSERQPNDMPLLATVDSRKRNYNILTKLNLIRGDRFGTEDGQWISLEDASKRRFLFESIEPDRQAEETKTNPIEAFFVLDSGVAF